MRQIAPAAAAPRHLAPIRTLGISPLSDCLIHV
jgi:hypothetical protein